MIKVPFVEPTTAEWQRWKVKGTKARETALAAITAGREPEINDHLYKEMKQVFLDAFSGKCAYCESRISADQPGDVEHFRPKACVTDEKDQPVMMPGPRGAQLPHPGYYWLAYDPSNLVPSCSKCNRPWKGPEGQLVGKWNRFPVKGFRATRPGEEAREEPLFINPISPTTDPTLHFKIDAAGIIGSSTDEGKLCIRLLALNRDGLVEARRATYLQIQALVVLVEAGAAIDGKVAEHLRLLTEHKQGRQPYSLAGRAAIAERLNRLRQLLEQLGD